MASFAEQARNAIHAEFHAISGSHDVQTSADVSNVGQFSLPDPAGRAGGACTSAILKILYRNQQMSWVSLLREMRTILRQMGYDQIPQLTSSRMVDVNKPFAIVPPGAQGARRAVLIGINYTGQQGQLSGCHNDVGNILKYLVDKQGFQERDCLVLMDDRNHHSPTRENIINAFQRITQYSNPGDSVFVHYSGHGGRLRDDDGDEDDGFDETLIPVDFKRAGQIRDDEVKKVLVVPMKAGVTVTCLMDCCHSGTVLDLPYRFDSNDTEMRPEKNFNFGSFLGSTEAQIGMMVCLYCCLSQMMQ